MVQIRKTSFSNIHKDKHSRLNFPPAVRYGGYLPRLPQGNDQYEIMKFGSVETDGKQPLNMTFNRTYLLREIIITAGIH